MKRLPAAVGFAGFILCASVSAQVALPKPRELDVLRQYVGHWTSDVTSKPAVWDHEGTKRHSVSQAEWILDGWFLQQIEVSQVVGDPDKVTKSLFLWTYDPKSEKYLAWAFQSNGKAASWTGRWDSTSKLFTLAAVEPPPKAAGKLTEQFADAKTIKGSLTYTDDGGKTLMDMAWTRKRQQDAESKATREKWSQIGTPVQPVPRDLAKLEPLIGEWDAQFIDGPSTVSPQLRASKGKMTAKWILDRHFLLGTTEQGNDRSIWIIGHYDYTDGTQYQTQYRIVRLTNAGQVDEALGAWNGEFDTIDWLIHIKRPGVTSTSTTQDYIGVDGNGGLRANILIRDAEEKKIYRSLTTKATRRK